MASNAPPVETLGAGITVRQFSQAHGLDPVQISRLTGFGVDDQLDRNDPNVVQALVNAARGQGLNGSTTGPGAPDTGAVGQSAPQFPPGNGPAAGLQRQSPSGLSNTGAVGSAPPSSSGPQAQREPQVAQAQPQAASQPQAAPPTAPQQTPMRTVALPPGLTEARAAALDQASAQNIINANDAARRGLDQQAANFRQQAQAQANTANTIRQAIYRSQRPTPEMQNAAAAGAANPLDYEQQKGMNAATVDQFKDQAAEASKDYKTAQSGLFRLDLIDQNIKSLGPNFMGSGADTRAQAAKAYNTMRDLLPEGLRDYTSPINPEKIASWEDFNKQTANLGFELARTLGAREAMQIVQQATKSVPNVEQSYWGARLVSASMRQAFQRQIDYHDFLAQTQGNYKTALQADTAFNQLHPVSDYVAQAVKVVPPQGAISYLQAHPEARAQFDAKYGDGPSVGVFGTQ